MSNEAFVEPDFKALFEGGPGLYMVLDPNLRIVAASDAYLQATMTRREDIIGRYVFDVFPDNPDDSTADAVPNSRASFNRVLQTRKADVMGLQRHDVRRPESEGGGFEVRYWSAVNTRILNPDGSIANILHRVENVTEFVQLKQQGVEQAELTDTLREQALQMEADIYSRTREAAETGRKLKQANEEQAKHREHLEELVKERTDRLEAANAQLKVEIGERQQAEKILGESEEKYREIVQNANSIILKYDAKGKIRFFNEYAQRFFGYSEDEIIGKDAMILVPETESNGKSLESLAEDILKDPEGFTENVNENILASGERVWVSWRNKAILDSDGCIVGNLAIGQDITERKRVEVALQEANEGLEVSTEELRVQNDELMSAQLALQKSEARLRRFYESGLIGVIYWNMDGVITDANDKFLEMVGYTRQDLVDGRIDWINMTPSEYQYLDENSAMELKATGVNKKPFEKEYIRKDGTRVPIIVAGAMLDESCFNGVAFVLDITERKRAEIALQESEQRWATTLSSIGDAVIATDTTGRLNFMNTVAEDLTGWTLKEASMKPVTEVFNIINEHTRQRVEDPAAKVIENGMIVGLANHTILVRKNGTEVAIDDSGAPIRDLDGDITGVVIVFRDITERKQAMKEIESLAKFPSENPNPVVRASADGTIIYANESSTPLLDLWGARVGQKLPGDYRNFIQGCIGSGVGNEIEATFNGITYSLVIAPVAGMDYANIYGQDITERKQMDEALRQSEHHYRLLYETMLQGIIYQDAEGKIISMNPAAERILGKTPAEFLGSSSVEEEHHTVREDGSLFPGLEHPSMVSLRTGRKVKDVIMGVYNPRVEGYRWIRIDAVPIFRPGEAKPFQVYILFDDITERKRAEEALRASEERYRTLFSSMTEGFALHEIVYDDEGQPCDYRFLEINPAFEKMTGLKRDDVVGQTHNQILPDDDPKWLQEYSKVAMTGNPVHFENYSPALKRHYEVYAYRPAPQQFAVVFTDITERKRAEDVLRTNLQRFYTILSRMYAGILLVTDKGQIEYANQAFCDLFDLYEPPEELVGLNAPELIEKIEGSYLDPEEAVARIAEIVEHGLPVKGEEVAMRGNRAFLRDFVPLYVEGRSYGRLWHHLDITERKRAEEALRLTQASIDVAAEMVAWFTSDGRVRYANDATCRMLGYTRDELLSMTALDFSPGFTWELYRQHWEDIRKRKSFTLEVTHSRKDGSTYPAEVQVNHVVYGGQEYIFAYGRDITERKRAEEALQEANEELECTAEELKNQNDELIQTQWALLESENRLRTIGDNLPESAVYQYVHEADGSARFLYFSAGIERLNAVRVGDVLLDAGSLHRQISPDYYERLVEAETRSASDLSDFDMEVPMHRPDGQVRWMRLRSRPHRMPDGRVIWDGVQTDVTERRKADESLRESRAKLRAALDSMTDAVFISDGEGNFLDFNDAFATFHRFGSKDECARTLSEYPDIIDVFMDSGELAPLDMWAVPRALRGEKVTNAEYKLRRKDTGVTWVGSYSFGPIRDKEGTIVGSVVVARDITDLKRAEERLRASLAEKEVLLKEIHHRVKNNMQVISSLISLQANSPADPATARILEDLRGRVRTMALVHEKLYLSQDISRIDFAEYARSLLHFIWQANMIDAARVQLQLDLQPLLLSVEAAVPCGLILNELATNALKHAFRGREAGIVIVSLHTGTDGRKCLKVSDNGIGLPADLDWRQSQTLGLQLVSMLTRQLSGTVEVEVRKGEGTEFRIAFGSKKAEMDQKGSPA